MFVTFLICALLSVAPLHNEYRVEDYTENNVVEKLERKNMTDDYSTKTISYNSDDFGNNQTCYDYWYSVYDSLHTDYNSSSNVLDVVGLFNGPSMAYSFNFDLIGIYTEYTYDSNGDNYFIKFKLSVGNISITLNNNSVSYSSSFYNTSAGSNTQLTWRSMSITSDDYYVIAGGTIPTMADEISVPMGEFVTILTAPIVGVATGVATGVSHMAESLFLASNQGTITGLSTFGGIMALFCGLGLAIHLTTRVYLWITSLGKD